MNAVVILLVGLAILVVAYITYGKWLAKQWGIDPSRPTPAHEMEDGKDYVPAKAPVLLGHHFSSIAGAGPINGPIQGGSIRMGSRIIMGTRRRHFLRRCPRLRRAVRFHPS